MRNELKRRDDIKFSEFSRWVSRYKYSPKLTNRYFW